MTSLNSIIKRVQPLWVLFYLLFALTPVLADFQSYAHRQKVATALQAKPNLATYLRLAAEKLLTNPPSDKLLIPDEYDIDSDQSFTLLDRLQLEIALSRALCLEKLLQLKKLFYNRQLSDTEKHVFDYQVVANILEARLSSQRGIVDSSTSKQKSSLVNNEPHPFFGFERRGFYFPNDSKDPQPLSAPYLISAWDRERLETLLVILEERLNSMLKTSAEFSVIISQHLQDLKAMRESIHGNISLQALLQSAFPLTIKAIERISKLLLNNQGCSPSGMTAFPIANLTATQFWQLARESIPSTLQKLAEERRLIETQTNSEPVIKDIDVARLELQTLQDRMQKAFTQQQGKNTQQLIREFNLFGGILGSNKQPIATKDSEQLKTVAASMEQALQAGVIWPSYALPKSYDQAFFSLIQVLEQLYPSIEGTTFSVCHTFKKAVSEPQPNNNQTTENQTIEEITFSPTNKISGPRNLLTETLNDPNYALDEHKAFGFFLRDLPAAEKQPTDLTLTRNSLNQLFEKSPFYYQLLSRYALQKEIRAYFALVETSRWELINSLDYDRNGQINQNDWTWYQRFFPSSQKASK